MKRTVGLPRMHKEPGERRDFLPELVDFLDRAGAESIVVEQGYGSGMGVAIDEYLRASPKVRVGPWDECVAQDVVCVVRCPSDDALRKMKRGTVLLTMCHYPTRPNRVALLRELGIRAVSMDGITEDFGERLLQNLEAVGWNGVRMAMRELARNYRHFEDPNRRAIRVLVMGAGRVGGHAARAATRYGDPAWRDALVKQGIPGVEVKIIDFDLTGRENYMLDQLERTDLLIDATYRPDPSRYVVPNDWVAALPTHAVMLDLSVDPYDFSVNPPEVKGIEGIPEGNLDSFVFQADDQAYERLDPRINTRHRRTALSCYSWPGVDPRACMQVYGKQVEPILRVLIEESLDALDPLRGRFFERAVARADVNRWKSAH